MMAMRSALRRSFPTVRFLIAPFRWLAGSRRRALAAAAVLLAIIAGLLLWWSMQLLGLPDIGVPLDGAASRSPRVPEDRDAFVLYRRAAEGITRSMRTRYQAWYEMQLLGRWSAALPELRRWAEGNRESLALFREAADRPDSTPLSDGDRAGLWRALRCLRSLALFEASRLEERGDTAGAWTWHRAVMRTIEHQVAYSRFAERKEALQWRDRLRDRLAAWAADPRTTAAMLRRAIDDAIACESMSPSDSDSFRAEYVDLMRSVDEPENPARRAAPGKWEAIFGVPHRYFSADRMQAIYGLWRFWRRESERSRRVIRLAVANWLACDDLPTDRRPPPDPDVSGPYEFYAFGPEAPAGARVLSPEALDRWLRTSPEAQEILDRWQMTRAFRVGRNWIVGFRRQERANRRALAVVLARQLYRRDHGADPPSDEALVGPYLESPPDDGVADAADRPGRRAAGAVQ